MREGLPDEYTFKQGNVHYFIRFSDCGCAAQKVFSFVLVFVWHWRLNLFCLETINLFLHTKLIIHTTD